MVDILRATDRWSRSIGLPEGNWVDKILLDHGEMVGNEESVRLTLIDPDLVAFDRDHEDREVFYRRAALPPPDSRSYLKVCVAFRRTRSGDVLGRVVTAYATDVLKPGEKPRWARRPPSRSTRST